MAPAPANDVNSDKADCGCACLALPGALPCISLDGKLIPTNDPPYNAKIAIGSFKNNAPKRPTTELLLTGSAAPASSLDSLKKIVNNDPKVGTVIGKAVGTKDDTDKGMVEVVVGRV